MTVLKTILSHALTVPFEDTALALAHASGQFLAPHVQPMEDWVMLLLNRHFPAQSAAFFHWIAAHQSPHTAKLAMMNPIHVLFAIMAYGTIVFVGCIIMRPLPPLQPQGVFLSSQSVLDSLVSLHGDQGDASIQNTRL
ncbi:hypothetical protein BSLG_010165 [Batrachochytrium salamandrivorans]|nr:hypothetical protein BSLG_010165 [Batrachochytrium salamandrivorans]